MSTHWVKNLATALIGLHSWVGAAEDHTEQSSAEFHHVQLNVTDAKATQQYYEKFFGALPVLYRNRQPALFTERSFILLNEVTSPVRSHHNTCLWHIGWAGVDGPSEFRWRKKAGIAIHTPIAALNNDHYMYFAGLENELVEVYTGSRNHRFEHVHLLATDVNQTIHWFEDHLGLKANRRDIAPPSPSADVNSLRGIWMNSIRVDNVNLVVFGRPRPGTQPFWLPNPPPEPFEPTKGSSIDHIAFSYRNIEPVFQRLQSAGVSIARAIQKDATSGHLSFYVVAPDSLLIEIVEAKPIPDGFWE